MVRQSADAALFVRPPQLHFLSSFCTPACLSEETLEGIQKIPAQPLGGASLSPVSCHQPFAPTDEALPFAVSHFPKAIPRRQPPHINHYPIRLILHCSSSILTYIPGISAQNFSTISDATSASSLQKHAAVMQSFRSFWRLSVSGLVVRYSPFL